MYFDHDQFPGNSLFWQVIFTYWTTFSLEVKVVLVVFVFVLLYICSKGNKKAKLFFVVGFFALIVVCINPWMCRYLTDNWKFAGRYFRNFWAFPVSMGYMYVALHIYERTGKKEKLALVIALLLLFGWSCRCLIKETGFGDVYTGDIPNTGMIPVSNIYKVEDDIVEVTKLIEDDSGDPYVDKKTLYDHDVFIEIRTYDASVLPLINYGMVPSDKNMEESINNSDYLAIVSEYFSGNTDGVTETNVSADLLKTAMDNTDCQYVILRNDNYYFDYWKEAFTSLGSAGRYTVFKVK